MRRVVVVGHGMVGSRFAEDLVAADPDVLVTVLGKEPTPAYNRVLLSSVVAGSKSADLLALATSQGPRLRVLTGVAARRIDRHRRQVVDGLGEAHPYDTLVLATGSVAHIPAIQGVGQAPGLVAGAFVLKDLADAHGIVAASRRARRCLVLGAGVLGLEVATGLARRGLEVGLVHHAERLMQRHLGWEAAAVAEIGLARLGIATHTSVSVAGVQVHRGRLSGMRLRDGSVLPTDLLVMCCGTTPEITLAAGARLDCGRGVTVDAEGRTSDPQIYAIGDCAEPAEGATGLVAQGWEQAARLVRLLTGDSQQGVGRSTNDVIRVKSYGMALVTMGVCGDFDRADPSYRVLSLKDPDAGRFVEVVVEGDRLVGATCIGDDEVGAALSALYTRRQPVPRDPAQLLVRALAGGAAAVVAKSPDQLAEADPVCTCNSVTAGRIRHAIADGCTTVADIAGATRATTGCGDCTAVVEGLLACHRQPAPAAA
jgi:assimilatory nitrate reductase electron transfer subunit